MKNVEIKVEGTKVTLSFDATQSFGKSSTGRSITVATTEGFQQVAVAGQVIGVSLNVNKKPS